MTENRDHNIYADTPARSTALHTTALIDRVIKDRVAPFLKGEGFHKEAGNFWRDTGHVVDVITVQKSQWNGPLESSFTIELGLYWKDIQRDLAFYSGTERPKAWDCIIRERIGTVLDGKDLWWSLTPQADAASIGLDVVDKLRSKALPWLVAGHDLAVAFRYASVYGESKHSDALKAVIEGRSITPLVPPVRKGFRAVDDQEFDMRTNDGRKAYRQERRKRPALVRFRGSDTVYDINSKEGKKAMSQFLERSKGLPSFSVPRGARTITLDDVKKMEDDE